MALVIVEEVIVVVEKVEVPVTWKAVCGLVVPMPTKPVEETKIVLVAPQELTP